MIGKPPATRYDISMFGPLTPVESARIAALPRISRARGGRLYALDGTRWLDCWADGGRGLAGHRPKGVSLRLKNEIDRGLYAPYPSIWQERLEKALLKLFPGYSEVRIFRNAEGAAAALNLSGPPVDPLDLPEGEGAEVLWGRPLLPGHPEADILFPVMPVPGLSNVQPVMMKSPGIETAPSDLISPIILASLVRSCSSISDRNTPIPEGFADIWERRGPYMLFQGDVKEYNLLFETLFARRVLIAPSLKRPSILPPDISAREISVLSGRSFT
jgi:hypothetical protein